MERYTLNLKAPIESIKAIIKDVEKYTIVMNGIEHVNAVIRNLPNRFYISPEYRAILFSSMFAVLYKTANVENEMRFNGIVNDILTRKYASAELSEMNLTSRTTSTLKKYLNAGRNTVSLDSLAVQPTLTRYRKLGEMDTDGVAELTLQEFDDMMLGDIDWYEV